MATDKKNYRRVDETIPDATDLFRNIVWITTTLILGLFFGILTWFLLYK